MSSALPSLTTDGRLLFATRFVRLFAYGALSVVLVLYLVTLGLSETDAGLLLTATLVGDALLSLFITTRADRVGRRRMLIVGASLMAAAGIAFAMTRQMWLLVAAGTIGVISPSGQEVGPFLSIEQAALSQVVADRDRTNVFAWYTLGGSIATALGALAAGFLTESLQKNAWTAVDSYRAVVVMYACLGAVLCLLFARASAAVEAPRAARSAQPSSLVARFAGLHRSQAVVLRLSALFALDSFGGGFVVQSFAAYWFYLRLGVDAKTLGTLFFAANVFAGLSALAASWLAGPHRPRQHHGGHASAVERAPDADPADADASARDAAVAAAIQHQPDGRPDATVVHDGGGRPGRTRRGIRHHGRRADGGRGDQSAVRGPALFAPVLDQRALLHRGNAEDRL